MRQLYYSLVAIIIWLSLLFNLEWLVSSFRLTPFLYVFIPACSVIVILGLKLHKLPLPSLLVIGLSAYAVFEYLFAYRMGTTDLTTVTVELSAVIITILLSSLIGKRLVNLQAMLTKLVIGPADQDAEVFEDAQGLLYREVRRARRYHHALAVLAISPPRVPQNLSLKPIPGEPFSMRVIEDMQRGLVEKYILVRTARLLRDELGDISMITQRGNHFVVLLPETTRDELQTILRALETAAQEQLGVMLNIGAATFPDQAITFEALLEQAEGDMVKQPEVSPVPATVPATVPVAVPVNGEVNGYHNLGLASSEGTNLTSSPT